MMGDLRLASEGFLAAPGINRPVGVYLLCAAQEVLYVGQSKNVYRRLGTHFTTRQRERRVRILGEVTDITTQVKIPFTHAMVRFCTERELDDLERMYIERYRPKYNASRPPVRRLKVKIEGLAEAAGIDWDSLETQPGIRRKVA